MDGFLWVALIITGTVLALGFVRLLGWLLSVRELRQLRRQHTVIAEYEAPKMLSPAELGFIFNQEFARNELLATIVRLYQLRAVALQPEHNDIAIMVRPEHPALDDTESTVYGYIDEPASGQAAIYWGQLDSWLSSVAGARDDLEESVVRSLAGKGYLVGNTITRQLFRKRVTSLILATILTALALLPFVYSLHIRQDAATLGPGFEEVDEQFTWLLVGLLAIVGWIGCFVLANLIAYEFYKYRGIPGAATPALKTLWPDVAGYRLFLRETEFPRLKIAPDAGDPAIAYCIALGLDPGFINSISKNA